MTDIFHLTQELELASTKITPTIVMVDAEMAKRWLARNIKNRPIRQTVLAKYKADMLAGRWLMAADPIRFNVDGDLTDGQHRLTAISEIPDLALPFLVVRGLPRDTCGITSRCSSRHGMPGAEVDASLSSHGPKAARGRPTTSLFPTDLPAPPGPLAGGAGSFTHSGDPHHLTKLGHMPSLVICPTGQRQDGPAPAPTENRPSPTSWRTGMSTASVAPEAAITADRLHYQTCDDAAVGRKVRWLLERDRGKRPAPGYLPIDLVTMDLDRHRGYCRCLQMQLESVKADLAVARKAHKSGRDKTFTIAELTAQRDALTAAIEASK